MSLYCKASASPKLKKSLALRNYTFIFQDILKCSVQLDRLSPVQIATASPSNTLSVAHDKDVQNFSIQCSPELDSPSENAHNTYKNIPSPFFSSLISTSDIDTDDDDSPEDGERVAYPIIFEENDTDTDDFHVRKDEHVTTNGETIGIQIKQISIIGDNHMGCHKNGNTMEHDNTPDSLAEFDDEDDDLRFLNGIAEQLDRTDNEIGVSKNCDENGDFWPSIRIFGNVCLKYIRDECYSTFCDFSHELPANVYVEKMLKTSSRQEIREAQNQLLLRNEILMNAFFSVFCKFYGREWQTYRESLRTLISIISLKPLASVHLKEILNGFLISGMVYSTCVEQILIELDESLNLTEQFELIWELIIDARNDKVDEQLTKFEKVLIGGALISSSAMNKIIELQIADELKCIRDVAINLVKRSKLETFQKIDSAKLKQYIWHVRSFDMNASKAIEQRAKQFGMNLDCLTQII